MTSLRRQLCIVSTLEKPIALQIQCKWFEFRNVDGQKSYIELRTAMNMKQN